MASTQAAVKAALKTALLARPGLSGVQVKYGEPGDDGRRELVYIGTSYETGPQVPAAFRVGRRDEDYTVKVFCETGLAATPEVTEARAIVLANEVEQTVVANSTLGVTNVVLVRPAGIDLRTHESGDGPVSVAEVSLAVKARLL